MTRHLTPKQLLRHLDGEMSNLAMRRAARHLQACWSCQVEYRRLQDDIGSILDAQTEVLAPSVPPPPGPWPRLEPRLDRAIRERSVPFWEKLSAFAGISVRARVAYACAALAALVVSFLVFVPATPVSAQEVLERVRAADAGRLAIKRNQVARQCVHTKKTARTGSAAQSARLESWKSPASTYWNSSGDAVNSDLFSRYEANGLASALPLSSPAVEQWIKLAGATPSASQKGEQIEVRVSSGASVQAKGLEAVSIEVRKADWHLSEMTLAFEDATFEITEEDSAVVSQREVPAEVLAQLDPAQLDLPQPMGPAALERPHVVKPGPAVNLDDLEMAVRYQLHSIGADLGENVEIAPLAPDRIVVKAASLSPERKRQITALLAENPGVQLQFDAPAPHQIPTKAVTLPRAGTSGEPGDRRLAEFFGAPETQENYTRSVLQSGGNVLAHFYALRDLAARWPAESEERLSPEAKARLAAMVRDHADEIRTGASEWEGQMDLLLKGFPYRPNGGGASNSADWRTSGDSGLDAARRADKTLRLLLTTSDKPLTLDEALPRLQESARDMERAIQDLRASLP